MAEEGFSIDVDEETKLRGLCGELLMSIYEWGKKSTEGLTPLIALAQHWDNFPGGMNERKVLIFSGTHALVEQMNELASIFKKAHVDLFGIEYEGSDDEPS